MAALPHAAARSVAVAEAFRWAAELDVRVRKPGNVSLASPGHRMVAAQFVDSARSAAPPLARAGVRVGARIEAAIHATLAVAGCNTNLGIVLLCAPLAAAAEETDAPASAAALKAAVARTLGDLDLDDARAAYRAIAAAQPAGLGQVPAQDVAVAPTVDLRQAMTLAAARDSIARQYANGFADVFEVGLPAWQRAGDPERALLAAWLAFLARWPDTHIVRKHGVTAAQTVTAEAARWYDAWRNGPQDADVMPAAALADWDERLKAAGINPGSSADLAVATAFVAALLNPRFVDR